MPSLLPLVHNAIRARQLRMDLLVEGEGSEGLQRATYSTALYGLG